jgi:type IV secretion system protein TrbL
MDDLSVIDRFTNVFSRYIDSGFGLLGHEVAFLTSTLVAIDITLAGLFWALGGNDDIVARLIKKTLYVGAFAYLITHFNELAGIVFNSFTGLGLIASGSTITPAEFLQPGRLAAAGVDAGRPILAQISELTGFPEVFHNLVSVVVLFLAWLLVILSFFVLAVQLFVTLIEFKLTALAGFVLLPFALWNKTAFLAERVLGNVMSAGIKVLVLAVIVGIGTGLFAQFQTPAGTPPTIDQALAIMLASLALLGLGVFGPGIATGLVAGAPQLGAGAAAGTTLGAAGLAAASGAAALGGTRALTGGMRSAALLASRSRSAYAEGASGAGGVRGAAAGMANVMRSAMASRGPSGSAAGEGGSRGSSQAPAWAQKMKRAQQISSGTSLALHTVRHADKGGSGASPKLDDDTQT